MFALGQTVYLHLSQGERSAANRAERDAAG